MNAVAEKVTRRGFLGMLAGAAAALGLAPLAGPLRAIEKRVCTVVLKNLTFFSAFQSYATRIWAQAGQPPRLLSLTRADGTSRIQIHFDNGVVLERGMRLEVFGWNGTWQNRQLLLSIVNRGDGAMVRNHEPRDLAVGFYSLAGVWTGRRHSYAIEWEEA